MQPNEKNTSEDDKPPKRGINLELFFFEQVGSRSYLRFTNLALFLILFLTLGAIGMLLALYVWNRNQKHEEINLNISVPTPMSTDPNRTLILPAPPPATPPKVFQPPGAGVSNRRIPSTPAGNGNMMPIPSLTPSPSPVRTPT